MDINQFQEKLKDIQTLAMQNGKKVHTELVEQFFDEPGMDKDKLQKVYDFLEVQGIYVEGYSKSRSKEAEADVPAEILALTPEEEAFLEEYLEGFVLPDQAEKEAVLKALKAGGDYEAEELLRCLQEDLIQAAKELNCREIFFGDLLQEGNMGLLMAVKSAEEQENLAKWLLEEARSTMRLFIEDQTQQKKEDNILVEKVRNLETRVKELTEDENVKYSVEELAAFLDMDPEEMEAVIKLTGDDK